MRDYCCLNCGDAGVVFDNDGTHTTLCDCQYCEPASSEIVPDISPTFEDIFGPDEVQICPQCGEVMYATQECPQCYYVEQK